ncbi:MAG TPA: AcrB/AcrD/AcrF family protein, partial [Cyanobacteria bacterium UBA9579]|nr:AcrB/AcrD/AcrF family protein [Cyanobacteria bacterium UBA9579]
MWLADISIKRPVFISMIILALVLFGIISYPTIGVDLYPKVDFPIVSISTTLRGASPEIMDIDVTDKVEGTINTINGVKSITSTSSEGVSNVIVEFELDRDIDFAVQDVREKMSFVRGQLPKDVDDPVIMKVDTDATPIMWIALSGSLPQRELSTYADEILKEKLQKIQGVGSLYMGGLRLRQIRIWLDREKLNTYGITAHDVVQALQRKNIELPGGRIEADTKEYSIKIKGELKDIEEFNNLIVKYQNGSAIKLKELAIVKDGMAEERSVSKFNGQRAIGIGIQKQSGTNTVKVIERVKAEIASIKKTLPAGMDIQVAFDQSTFIKRSIEEVQKHLILGGILTVLIVFLFLKSMRLTWISAVAIPVSIITTFAMMKIMGFTFNNMTMLALSLSIGVVIDDAIVVIENIHRHVQNGMHPREAASFATREIGLAVVATTIAIMVIFLPVAFMQGIIGRFFMQFALTVVFAVMISLVISFTITPMLASRIMKHKSQENSENAFYNWLESNYKRFEEVYRKILIFALNNRKKIIISAVAIFIFSLFMTKFIGKEFVPSEDQGSFMVNLVAPIDYSVKMTNNLFAKAEAIVKDVPEVSTIFYAQGSGHANEVNKGVMFVNLKPGHDRKRKQQEIQADVRKQLNTVIGLESSVEDISLIGGGSRRVPIQFIVKGDDLNELEKYISQIKEEYSKLPGIVDLDTSIETGKPEVRVMIDRDRAADLSVDIATIVETINFLMSGEIDITKYKDSAKGRRYDVRMRLLQEDRLSPQDIGQIYVRSTKGEFVQLSNIINIQEAGGPSAITRLDRQRAVTLFANLEGKPL